MYWPGQGGCVALESSLPFLLVSVYLQIQGKANIFPNKLFIVSNDKNNLSVIQLHWINSIQTMDGTLWVDKFMVLLIVD